MVGSGREESEFDGDGREESLSVEDCEAGVEFGESEVGGLVRIGLEREIVGLESVSKSKCEEGFERIVKERESVLDEEESEIFLKGKLSSIKTTSRETRVFFIVKS
jgi:hypothetical protein